MTSSGPCDPSGLRRGHVNTMSALVYSGNAHTTHGSSEYSVVVRHEDDVVVEDDDDGRAVQEVVVLSKLGLVVDDDEHERFSYAR
uniref:Uncharacterized protein n=1 Tax=Pristionchus pacificus TaxID=54126 RepID=A0A8R1V127_PRIPA